MTSWKEKPQQQSKRPFTLLEVMIALALLLIASGVIGMKMYHAVQKKQFQSAVERLRTRLLVSQKLAVVMQADWKGVLKKKGKEWIFEAACEEVNARKFAPLRFSVAEIRFNGRRIDQLTLDFFATGQVLPEGTLLFSSDSEKVRWETADLFQREAGKGLGPLHPADDS